MNEGERAGLANMRDRWITGGAAADLAPPEWKEAVSAAPAESRERLLLAIAGQALDTALRPAAPATLKARAPLPKLGLPILPEPLTPLLRGALRQAGADAAGRMQVIRLAAARGFVAHPLDWMPPASGEEPPQVYAPWVDWQQDGGAAGPAPEELTADNWNEFFPAARRIALADMRRADPARARALLEAKAAGEPAETRLPLIEVLRNNLSAADAPYLEGLGADRSGKVKQLAARLLARIGRAVADGEGGTGAAELAEFIEKTRTGFLRRRTVFTPRILKSHAQGARRVELFDACQLRDLARALEVTEDELVANWQLGVQHDADRDFTAMISASGSDAALAAYAERLFETRNLPLVLSLLPRLGDWEQRRFVELALAAGTSHRHFLRLAAVEAGTLGRRELMDSRLYREVREAVALRAAGGAPSFELADLGFLASAAAAAAIISDLVGVGFAPADPSLALLRLNAALREEGETNWRRS